MNEHARKIWKAWADGMGVQYWTTTSSKWIDIEPQTLPQTRQPQNAPHFWRIKPPPRRLTARYRVWIMRLSDGSVCPVIHHIKGKDDIRSKVEASERFLRWDGPERRIEVEVEE